MSDNRATTIFVLGLLSLVSCQILGPVAFVMGNSYLRDCAAMDVEPDGLAKAGRIMGMIGSVLLILTFVFVVLYVGVIAAVIALEP